MVRNDGSSCCSFSASHSLPRRSSRFAFIVRKNGAARRLRRVVCTKSVKRIDIVEQVAIDAKRKLVLVRRDDVEHLVMTGGPADIVIESGIGAPAQRRSARAVDAAAAVAAPARASGRRSLSAAASIDL